MNLEDKIKALLEGKTEEAVSEQELAENESTEVIVTDEAPAEAAIMEDDEAAKNAKIVAGKGRKLEVDKVKGEPSTDEPNNKRNAKGTPLQKGAEKNPVGEHVEALMDGEDLSEEFKVKAGAIMEAAIADGVAKEVTRLEEQYAIQLDEAVEEMKEGIVAEIDGYLTEAVEKWMADNELALESGIKSDITENFVNGLKDLFKENYIEVPEEKYNVLDEQAEKIDELTSLLDESTSTIETLTVEVKTLSKYRVMESVGDSLTDTEYEKFAGLLEGVEFTSTEEFEEKAKTIKESYFPKTKRESVISESDEPASNMLVEGVMSKYVDALANPLSFKR